MAELKVGKVIDVQRLSPLLVTFRVLPEGDSRFPTYLAGQYIALRRDDCKLTKAATDANGERIYVPDLDGSDKQKIGPVTHSYSIASAPWETGAHGWLEFYVVLEKNEDGSLGRLSPVLLGLDARANDTVKYVNRITGVFTLPKKAAGFKNVVLIGTGTGLAPFIAMIKQLHHEAGLGKSDGVKYTLLHTNRTYEELAFHQELIDIEAAQRFDFVYVPSVSRPTARDLADPRMGRGRANNVLRHILSMPPKEEEELQALKAKGADTSKAKAALDRMVAAAMPGHIPVGELKKRFDSPTTVILTCGNPSSMTDIKHAADTNGIHFEKEDW